MKRVAVVVTLNRYASPSVQPLSYSKRDGRRTVDRLWSGLGFDRVVHLHGKKVREASVRAAVVREMSDLQPGDFFVFYFSGHAVQKVQDGMPFLACYDASAKAIHHGSGDFLALSALFEDLAPYPGIQVLLLLDGCRQVLLAGGKSMDGVTSNFAAGVKNLVGPKGPGPRIEGDITVLCSCSAGSSAYESHRKKGSVFTLAFWESVKACLKEKGVVDLDPGFVDQRLKPIMNRISGAAGLGSQNPEIFSAKASLPPRLEVRRGFFHRSCRAGIARVLAAVLAIPVGLLVLTAPQAGWTEFGPRLSIPGILGRGGIGPTPEAVSVGPVAGFRIRTGAGGGLALSWSDRPSLRYRLWHGREPDPGKAVVLTQEPLDGGEYLDPRPWPGRSFYWVQEVGQGEVGPMGDPVEGWALVGPNLLHAQRGIDGGLSLAWQPPTSGLPRDDFQWQVEVAVAGEPRPRLLQSFGPSVTNIQHEFTRDLGTQDLVATVFGRSERWGRSAGAVVTNGAVQPPKVGKWAIRTNETLIYWPARVERVLVYEWVMRRDEGRGGTEVSKRWSPGDPEAALTITEGNEVGAVIPVPKVKTDGRSYRLEAVNAGGRTPVSDWIVVHPTPATPFTSSIGQRLVLLPGTNHLMAIWEFRVKDFTVYARSVNHHGRGFWGWDPGTTNWFVNESLSWEKPGFQQTPDDPVTGISYEVATNVCAWLTQRDRELGLLGPRDRYRLPTDREWSLAVGLGNEEGATPAERGRKPGDQYPWGRTWPPGPRAGNYADESAKKKYPTWSVIAGYDDGFPETSPVGSFDPNPYGFYDLGGNVFEWCEDFYDGKEGSRVLRGASWIHIGDSKLHRSASRGECPPGYCSSHSGFRLVLERDLSVSE